MGNRNITDKNGVHVYITLARTFTSYRWYKPILIGLLTAAFYLAFELIINLVALIFNNQDLEALFDSGINYDSIDVFSVSGVLTNIGSLAALLPALFFAVLIIKERPFSSYSSSRGGWNKYLFFKSLAIAAAVCGSFFIIGIISDGGFKSSGILFDIPGFIILTILLPFQCIAEEYFFRAYLMQTFGAWFKSPIVAIILQSAVFVLFHPYNLIGMIAIFTSGIIYGIIVHKTNGLEATCAIHIVSNFISFYLAGFGLEKITSEIDILSMVISVSMDVIFAIIVITAGNKKGWFSGIINYKNSWQ